MSEFVPTLQVRNGCGAITHKPRPCLGSRDTASRHHSHSIAPAHIRFWRRADKTIRAASSVNSLRYDTWSLAQHAAGCKANLFPKQRHKHQVQTCGKMPISKPPSLASSLDCHTNAIACPKQARPLRWLCAAVQVYGDPPIIKCPVCIAALTLRHKPVSSWCNGLCFA